MNTLLEECHTGLQKAFEGFKVHMSDLLTDQRLNVL
jgi:hypothetical protein